MTGYRDGTGTLCGERSALDGVTAQDAIQN